MIDFMKRLAFVCILTLAFTVANADIPLTQADYVLATASVKDKAFLGCSCYAKETIVDSSGHPLSFTITVTKYSFASEDPILPPIVRELIPALGKFQRTDVYPLPPKNRQNSGTYTCAVFATDVRFNLGVDAQTKLFDKLECSFDVGVTTRFGSTIWGYDRQRLK